MAARPARFAFGPVCALQIEAEERRDLRILRRLLHVDDEAQLVVVLRAILMVSQTMVAPGTTPLAPAAATTIGGDVLSCESILPVALQFREYSIAPVLPLILSGCDVSSVQS